MIAAALRCDVTDGAAEFAFDHDQRVVEQRFAVRLGNDRQVRDQVRQAGIQLPCGRIDAGVWGVDVLVIIPAAKGDLDVSRSFTGP